MEDKAEVGVPVEIVQETELSQAFASRREMWAHLLKGGAVGHNTDYSQYNSFVRPWVAAIERNGDALWNYGARMPFLAANKLGDALRSRISKPNNNSAGGK